LDIIGNDVNIATTGGTNILNITSLAGIQNTAGGFFNVTAGGGMGIQAGGLISILTPGQINIGSGNLLGFTTSLEKFDFDDSDLSKLSGALDFTLNDVGQIANAAAPLLIKGTGGPTTSGLVFQNEIGGINTAQLALVNSNTVVLGDTSFAGNTVLQFKLTGPLTANMNFDGTQFNMDTKLNMNNRDLLGVSSLTATSIYDSTASFGTATQLLSAGAAGGELLWITAPGSGFTPFTSITGTASDIFIPASFADSVTYYLQNGGNPTVRALIVADDPTYINLPPGTTITFAMNPSTPTPASVLVSVTTLAFPTVFNDLFTIIYPDTNNRHTAMKVSFGGGGSSWVWMKAV
jgi:hypothetical protein